ncbi:MAG: hypothetical protein ACOX6S_02950 [Clostridia bacterium]|jgi:hypothetical protein
MKREEIHHLLYQAIQPLYRRLMMQRRMTTLFYCCLAALIQALIWVAASFLLPIEDLLIKTMAGGMVVFLAILLAREIWRPSLAASAAKLDALGFQERITTALEMGIRDDAFAQLQRQDTILHLEKFPYRERMPLSLGYRRPFLLLAMVLWILALSFIPNPQKAVLEKRAALQAELKEQAEKIQQAVDERSQSGEPTEEREKEVRELLRELSKRLLRSRDYKEALKEISKTEDKLGEILRKEGEERLDRMSQAMKKHEITQALGEAVANRDMERMKRELDKLREEVRKENPNAEMMKALETAMKEIGGSLPEDSLKEEILGAAKAAAEAAAGFDGGEDLADRLVAIGEGLEALTQGRQMTGQELEALLQMAREGIADTAGDQDSRIGGGDPGENSHGSSSDQQGNSGSGQGNTGSQGEQERSAGNASQGENGSGNGGGAGTGSGQSDEGYKEGEPSTASPGKKTGDEEKSTEYERVYVPKRLGGDSKASQVKGNPGNQGDSSQVEMGKGIGNMGGFIPYNQVFEEYSSQASKAMERDRIPANMRSWVEAYFTSLDE